MIDSTNYEAAAKLLKEQLTRAESNEFAKGEADMVRMRLATLEQEAAWNELRRIQVKVSLAVMEAQRRQAEQACDYYRSMAQLAAATERQAAAFERIAAALEAK